MQAQPTQRAKTPDVKRGDHLPPHCKHGEWQFAGADRKRGASKWRAGEFEVGRPAGVKPGETLAFPMAFRFNGIAHAPGGYVWECGVDGETVARWPFQAVE